MACGGVQPTFSVLEASEEKFPALRAFVLPTHFPSGSGNLVQLYLISNLDKSIYCNQRLLKIFSHLFAMIIMMVILMIMMTKNDQIPYKYYDFSAKMYQF